MIEPMMHSVMSISALMLMLRYKTPSEMIGAPSAAEAESQI